MKLFSHQSLWGKLEEEDKSINNMASISLGLKVARQSHIKCLELEGEDNALFLEQTEQTKPLSEFYLTLHDIYTEHRHALLSTTERQTWTGMKKKGEYGLGQSMPVAKLLRPLASWEFADKDVGNVSSQWMTYFHREQLSQILCQVKLKQTCPFGMQLLERSMWVAQAFLLKLSFLLNPRVGWDFN